MARNTSISDRNELTIQDNISDSEVKLYYRTPETRERQGFSNLSIMRKGRKIKLNQATARLKYGLRILTGFRYGDFERNVDGKAVPYSSDKGHENYLPTWKRELKEGAADLVMLLGAHVFEGSASIDDGVVDDELEDEFDGDTGDLDEEEISLGAVIEDEFPEDDAEKNSHETSRQ